VIFILANHCRAILAALQVPLPAPNNAGNLRNSVRQAIGLYLWGKELL